MAIDVEVMSLIRMLKPRFFEGLSSLEVASIIALATDRPFPKRSVMAHEGYPAKYLFLMIRGRALRSHHSPSQLMSCLQQPPNQINHSVQAALIEVKDHRELYGEISEHTMTLPRREQAKSSLVMRSHRPYFVSVR
jgi:hypothetical protein